MKKLSTHHINFRIVMSLSLILILFLAACGSSSQQKSNQGGNWELGQGDLSDSIGNKDAVSDAVNELIQQGFYTDNFEIWKKLGYNEPKGKWFFHNGAGIFGYGLTTGTQKSGAEYFVSIIGHNPNGEKLDRNVRIQLTEVQGNINDKELLIEETVYVDTVGNEEIIYTNNLPTKENATYVLSAEILNDQGEVEDTRVATIYVPKEEMNASLSTDKQVYEKGGTEAKLTLTNYGPTFLMFGKDFTIEKKVNDEWRIVPLDLAFEAIGIMLAVGDEYEQKVDLSSLDEGEYRIVKSFGAEGFDLRATLAAEFMIK